MSQFNYILAGGSITVFVDGKSYTVSRTAKTFDLVLNAIKANDLDGLRAALDIRSSIAESLNRVSDKVTINDGEILYGDRPVTGLVASRIFEMLSLSLDVKPMVRFIENLMQNPSNRAVNELFGFLDACSLPITEDGYFLAYKRVRGDYLDCYSGTMDNSVGNVLRMERNEVDEDSDRTCSHGLHVCSYDYLQHFSGDRIVVCKINPRDVVAVPKDYNNSKMRVCEYEVVDEIPVVDYMPSKRLTDFYTNEYSNLQDEDFEDDGDFDGEDWEDDWEDDDSNFTSLYDLDQSEYDGLIEDIEQYESGHGGLSIEDIASWWNVHPDAVYRLVDSRSVASGNNRPPVGGVASKIDPTKVAVIRSLLNQGESLAEIARRTGVSARTVGRIRDGKR